MDSSACSGKSVPRKPAGAVEGMAGTVGSVKACLEGGDVGERAARARRRALTKAVGRGLSRGCIPVAGSFPELSAQDQSLRG